MKIKERWVSWEEFDLLFPGLSPTSPVDFGRVGGLTPGSIPFADATGFLAQDNANLSWNDTLNVLEVGAPTKSTYIGKGVVGAGNDTGIRNVYIGYEAGYESTENSESVFIGYFAGRSAYSSSSVGNTLIGAYAGHAITTSQLNICVGTRAGRNITTGQGQNVFLGYECGGATTGIRNVSIGQWSGNFITTGHGNICIGYNAEVYDADSNYRIAIGYQAMSKEDNLCVIGGGTVSYHLAIFKKREFRFYDAGAGSNYVGFEAPELELSQIWVLPTADGNINDFLQTDGEGNLSWAAGAEVDEKVKVDAEATTGYLGAAFNDGVLRTGAPLTYTDEGDFITLGVDQTAIDHDVLTNTHDNPYKLDDLAAPDDNTDLDFSIAKHGLVPKGTDVGHFLKDDGTWAAGGGGGAVVFPDLTDTPANYVGAGDKIVKVNATPDALEFGADIEDLEDVDTIVGQAGKYAKVKDGDAGIEWAAVAGDGGGLGRLDVDEDFEGLDIGTIDGQGSYTGWETWAVTAGANTSAEIVDIGGDYDKILRLARTEGSNEVKCDLDFNDSDNNWGLRSGFYIRFKVRANPDNIAYCWLQFRTISGNVHRFSVYFDPTQTYKFYYDGGSAVTIWSTVDDTWYDVALILFPGYANPYLQVFKDSSFNSSKSCGSPGNNDLNRIRIRLNAGSGAVVYDIAYLKVYNLMMPA